MNHEQAKIRAASLLPEHIETPFRNAVPTIPITHLEQLDATTIPADASVLIAAPHIVRAFGDRPVGWPFGLRWVHLISAGLDGYPAWLFDGVTVTYSPGATALPISEYCIAAMLMAAKRLPDIQVTHPDQWQITPLRTISGKTLGIVGFGAIGSRLATSALALGMNVQAVRASDAPLASGVHRAESIDALFASSDHIVLAMPATAQNRHIVNESLLAKVRRGAHLINVSRGSLIDQEALLVALDSGLLARATLDVTDPEPLPEGHRLYSHPRVMLTPHSAASGEETLNLLAVLFAENLLLFQAGKPLHHVATSMAGTQ